MILDLIAWYGLAVASFTLLVRWGEKRRERNQARFANVHEQASATNNNNAGRTLWDRIILVSIYAAAVYTAIFVYGFLDDYFFGYVQGHHKFISNPLDHNEAMPIIINLRSSVMASNSPITAFVELNTNHNYRSEHFPNVAPLPDKYRIEFKGAYCQEIPSNPYQRIDGCYFDLDLVDQIGIYQQRKEMWFSYGGQFDVSLYLPTSNDTQVTHVDEKFIQIDSVESTSTFRTFKAIFVIGIVGVILGFVTWYQSFRRDRWGQV